MPTFKDRRPVKALQTLQHRFDRRWSVIRQGQIVCFGETDLFVLCPNTPIRFGFAALGKAINQICFALDQLSRRFRCSTHERPAKRLRAKAQD